MSVIDINNLTDEQRKALKAQLREEEKARKEARIKSLEALEGLAAESVPTSFSLLQEASDTLKKAKEQIFINFQNYLQLKIEVMGIKARNQQSHSITYGNQTIKIGYRVTDGYTDEAGYGLEMVHRFLGSLAKDEASQKLVNSIYRLLQRNGKGDLDSKKVLELKQIADKDFPETDLQRGVEIIQNSYRPKLSKWFIEAWYVDNVGIERNIPLSITSIELPKDIDLSFLLPKN